MDYYVAKEGCQTTISSLDEKITGLKPINALSSNGCNKYSSTKQNTEQHVKRKNAYDRT